MGRILEKFRIFAYCYSPNRIISRLGGPRVFANSVPKSGTNLLAKCLFLFPYLRPSGPLHRLRIAGRHVHMNYNRNGDSDDFRQKLDKTKAGQYMTGHVFYTEENSNILEQEPIRSILIIRDPRDVAVSHYHWVTEKNTSHRLHDYYVNLPDDDARLMASIKGVSGKYADDGNRFEGVLEWMDSFYKWNAENYNLTVKFEDLIGPNGGGDKQSQKEAIQKISEHIGKPISEKRVDYIANNLFDTESSTFRKGLIGDWENEFNERHKEAFKQKSSNMLTELGYVQDSSW